MAPETREVGTRDLSDVTKQQTRQINPSKKSIFSQQMSTNILDFIHASFNHMVLFKMTNNELTDLEKGGGFVAILQKIVLHQLNRVPPFCPDDII